MACPYAVSSPQSHNGSKSPTASQQRIRNSPIILVWAQHWTKERRNTQRKRRAVRRSSQELAVTESTRGVTDATICDDRDGLGSGAGASKTKASSRWCGLAFYRPACANLYRQELSIVKKAVDIVTEQGTGGYDKDVVQAKLLVHTIAARRTARRAGFEGEGDLEVSMESRCLSLQPTF
ncbi:hypothetical protein LTS18_003378 [Coniosporium uncinatum]|uniref:Uncharacterized protein n=1 Tax=Coniosporium uncinatum TaxID=93489 RepID=A0ACC3DZG1_9PEZI|nr:hypothetical protein LTS18_003378 [Coniosporium uncinatum]